MGDAPDPVHVRAREGEVVTDRAARRVELLGVHPQLVITWSRYGPGERGPDPHIHTAHADCFFVLEGALEFGVGPDRKALTLSAGELLAVPANVVHTFVNAGGEDAVFLNFHAPGAGFAESLRGHPERFDTHDPPQDGGLPSEHAVHVAPEQGHSVRSGASELLIKLGADDAGGHLALSQITLAPGFEGPPPHRHAVMVDAFCVLDGAVTFTVEGEPIEAGPGDVAFVAPGTLHTFANESRAPARMLNLFAPAGLERYLLELSALLDGGAALTPALMGRLASRHDFLLG